LARALHARGHEIVFFEHDLYWYADNRDLPDPDFCRLHIVAGWSGPPISAELVDCDVAVLGSFVPRGTMIADRILDSAVPVKAFYDIDTPITLEQLRVGGETSYLRADQIPGFDIYFSFTGGPVLSELESRFRAHRARALYCGVDPAQYQRRLSSRYMCDLSYMGTYAPDRQPKLEELLLAPARQMPDHNFIVAGPQYPRVIRWPKNVRRIRHLNPRWHPHLYSSSRFTLNVTRREMVRAGYSPSVRLFEAAACGATLISDNWPGLDEFFAPGEEILLPSCAEDVKNYLCNLSDADVRRIGGAAQARALSSHTSSQRACEFESAVEEVLGTSEKNQSAETLCAAP
jgi:spore maturation protein CgeB